MRGLGRVADQGDDRRGPEAPGQRQQEGADAARGGGNHDRLAGLQPGGLAQQQHGGGARHGQAAGLIGIDASGAWADLVGVRQRELRVAAVAVAADQAEHGVPRREVRDPGTDRSDRSGDLAARHEGEDGRKRVGVAAATLHVGEIDRGGLDADQHLAGAGLGNGDDVEAQLVDAARAGGDDGLHGAGEGHGGVPSRATKRFVIPLNPEGGANGH